MIQRGHGALRGLWSFPGGHIEPGETARAAAIREIREETAVEVQLAGLLDIHEVMRRDSQGALEAHYLLVVYFGRWAKGEPKAGGDAAAARFVPLDAVSSLPTTEAAPTFILQAWEKLQPAELQR
jgi:8-oxo-dGTP diphosphatase